MIGTYKDFYKFVQINNPLICNLWEEFNNRPDPKEGDEFIYYKPLTEYDVSCIVDVIFDKVLFDSKFDNGVAFYYIFYKKDTGEEVRVHSINDVYDYKKLTIEDQTDLFSFWKNCIPKKIKYESISIST